MNIGIDVDGVLQNIYKFMIEEGTKYCKENNKGSLINSEAYMTYDMFGWDYETDVNFWVKNVFSYAEKGEVLSKASENINRLKEDGHKTLIITARCSGNTQYSKYFSIQDEQKMKITTTEWLNKNNIIFDEIIFSGEDKAKDIIENNIDVMIEDSPKNLEQLSKITKMICVDWPYNKAVNKDNIYRCYNWDEIYDIINLIETKENV